MDRGCHRLEVGLLRVIQSARNVARGPAVLTPQRPENGDRCLSRAGRGCRQGGGLLPPDPDVRGASTFPRLPTGARGSVNSALGSHELIGSPCSAGVSVLPLPRWEQGGPQRLRLAVYPTAPCRGGRARHTSNISLTRGLPWAPAAVMVRTGTSGPKAAGVGRRPPGDPRLADVTFLWSDVSRNKHRGPNREGVPGHRLSWLCVRQLGT